MRLQDDKVYIALSTCGTIEIPLTGEDINSICKWGTSNDEDVEYVCNNPKLRSWMNRYSKELIREEVRDYGNWTEEELANDEDNIQRLVWLLSWEIFESEDPDFYLANEEFQNSYTS